MKALLHFPAEATATAIPQRSGFVRLKAILAPEGPIPVGRSTWWAGVRSGRFPAAVKLGPRTTAWRREDIADLVASFDGPK